MADYVVQESDGTSKFTLEDASGAILLEVQPAAGALFVNLAGTGGLGSYGGLAGVGGGLAG